MRWMVSFAFCTASGLKKPALSITSALALVGRDVMTRNATSSGARMVREGLYFMRMSPLATLQPAYQWRQTARYDGARHDPTHPTPGSSRRRGRRGDGGAAGLPHTRPNP